MDQRYQDGWGKRNGQPLFYNGEPLYKPTLTPFMQDLMRKNEMAQKGGVPSSIFDSYRDKNPGFIPMEEQDYQDLQDAWALKVREWENPYQLPNLDLGGQVDPRAGYTVNQQPELEDDTDEIMKVEAPDLSKLQEEFTSVFPHPSARSYQAQIPGWAGFNAQPGYNQSQFTEGEAFRIWSKHFDHYVSLDSQHRRRFLELVPKGRAGMLSEDEFNEYGDLMSGFIPDNLWQHMKPGLTANYNKNAHGKGFDNPDDGMYTDFQEYVIPDDTQGVPLWVNFSGISEEEAETVKMDDTLSGFFQQHESSPSARVQAILADTYQKFKATDITPDDKAAILDNASNRTNDNSMFQIMGGHIWYNDEPYDLYDPRIDTDTLDLGSAETVFINDPASIAGFHFAQALGGMALEDDDAYVNSYTRAQGGAIAVTNALQSFVNNSYVNGIHLVLLKTKDGRRRAYLQAGSSDIKKQMDSFNESGEYLLANVAMNNGSMALAQTFVNSLYERVTGWKAVSQLELKMTLDPRHKNEAYYGYIIGEDHGNVLYATPVYSGDRLEFIEYPNGRTICDLSSKISPLYISKDGINDLTKYFAQIEKNKQ